MSPSWTPSAAALELLERAGPFDRLAYRRAWLERDPASRDASFGAEAADGTRAAIALVATGRSAAWPPLGYSGIASSRALDADEQRAFLVAARRAAGAARLGCRAVAFAGAPPPLHGAAQVAATSVVSFAAGPPEEQLAKKARQSIRRAARAGCEAQAGSAAPDAFLGLYQPVARARGVEYPEAVVRALAHAGVARFYDVTIDGEPVSSLIALAGATHWMYWAAAQSAAGRAAEAGYLAAAGMLSDAHAAGAQHVNLGASASRGQDLAGVAQFKRRLGGVDAAVLELSSASALGRAAALIARLRR